MSRWTATVARGDRVQKWNKRCSISGSSRSHTMRRLVSYTTVAAMMFMFSAQYFPQAPKQKIFFALCHSSSGTPGRFEGAGLAREGQNNAGALDWQVRGSILWLSFSHSHSGKPRMRIRVNYIHSLFACARRRPAYTTSCVKNVPTSIASLLWYIEHQTGWEGHSTLVFLQSE